MPTRLAAILALLVFAACLVGGLEADNTFTTTVARALAAMGGTYVLGLVLGAMGQRMIDENLKPVVKEIEESKELKGKKSASGR